ncbi:hypothetical protein CMV_009476 [Castanea mollissima]|uniref:Uncharacterized protein n=1 Tax=Castanea mollissima TaxID=60419 RepID=A0A8J4VQX3_9ROSI|nr:hypothetical protein CMV_009476 [Castanea mollissima]
MKWPSYSQPAENFVQELKDGDELASKMKILDWDSSNSQWGSVYGTMFDSRGNTGPLYNGHSSSISYGLLNQKLLNLGFISNENETYFSYSVNKDFSTVPRFPIDYGGALLGFRYSTAYSEVLCISSDPSLSVGLGCVKQKLPGCRSPYDAVKGNYGSILLCLKITWNQMGITCSQVVKLQKVARDKNDKKIRIMPQD